MIWMKIEGTMDKPSSETVKQVTKDSKKGNGRWIKEYCIGDTRVPEIAKNNHFRVVAGIFSDGINVTSHQWSGPGRNPENPDRAIV